MYILEESEFKLMYVRLCDLDIPSETMAKLFATYPFGDLQIKMG